MYIYRELKMLRKPDWVWNRIMELRDSGAEPQVPRDDKWVFGGYAFMRRLDAAGNDEAALHHLRDSVPDYYDAYRLHSRATMPVRAVLHAMLCGQKRSFAEIAEAIDTTAEVVECYSHVWFDVTDMNRLTITIAVKPELVLMGDDLDLEAMLTLCEFISPALTDVVLGHRMDEAAIREILKAHKAIAARKALIATAILPVTSETALDVLKTTEKLQKTLEPDLQPSGEQDAEGILELLQKHGLGQSVASEAAPYEPAAPVPEPAATSAEVLSPTETGPSDTEAADEASRKVS